jgi:hypothetical protein
MPREQKVECPRCRGTLEKGFVMDRAHYSYPDRQNWVEGEPEKSVWHGFKTKGKESYLVHTFRCEKCGYLESYATEPPKK